MFDCMDAIGKYGRLEITGTRDLLGGGHHRLHCDSRSRLF